jgi:hypothetical protein
VGEEEASFGGGKDTVGVRVRAEDEVGVEEGFAMFLDEVMCEEKEWGDLVWTFPSETG